MLTLLMHFRLKEKNIPIVALYPGWVRTDMGGSKASLSPEDSARSIAKVVENLNADSSLYLNYRGDELPW